MSHTLKTAGPFKILRKSPKFLEVRQPVTTTKHSNLRGIRCLHQLKLSLDLHGNLPETGRLTRQKKKMPFRKNAASKMRRQPCQRGFSVRKNPVRSTGGRKGWRTIFSALWRVHPSCLSIGNKTANKKLETHMINVAPGRKARKITEQLCFYKSLPLVWVVSWSKGLQFKVIAEPHFEHTYHGYLEPFLFRRNGLYVFFLETRFKVLALSHKTAPQVFPKEHPNTCGKSLVKWKTFAPKRHLQIDSHYFRCIYIYTYTYIYISDLLHLIVLLFSECS